MTGQVLHFACETNAGNIGGGGCKEKEVSAEWKRLAVCCALLLTADISQDIYYHVTMSSGKFRLTEFFL